MDRRFVIRPRTQADVAACIAALRTVHTADDYPSVWPNDPAAWLTPDGLLEAWIALREGAIAGHVMLCRVDPRAGPPHFILPSESGGAFALGEIKRLFVVPSARRSGAATQLLATAAHEARRRELHPVLETTADNASGIGFYVKNGWVHVGSQIASWTHPSGEHPLMHQFELPAQAMPTESA